MYGIPLCANPPCVMWPHIVISIPWYHKEEDDHWGTDMHKTNMAKHFPEKGNADKTHWRNVERSLFAKEG